MNVTAQLANRFKEVILDGTWVANTNYKHQLLQLTWEQATTKISSLNTVAVLTFHINYYVEGVLNVFNGGNLEIKDQYSFDCPPIASKTDWEALINRLWKNAEDFYEAIKKMPDTQLNEVFVDQKYGTYRRNIEGMIEHSYYHLGQISLLRKMLLELP